MDLFWECDVSLTLEHLQMSFTPEKNYILISEDTENIRKIQYNLFKTSIKLKTEVNVLNLIKGFYKILQ